MLRLAPYYLLSIVLLTAVGLLFITGCPAPNDQADTSAGNMAAPTNEAANIAPATTAPADGKVKVIGYINVASGCQAETVDLLNKLGMDNHDLVDMEIVDFGSTDGEERWRKDGLDCMTLLFNGSPAVKFPGPDGVERTVVFFMPAGMSWTHEDLEAAFAAIKAGKLQILTEEEAQQEMAPKFVELKATTRQRGNAAEVLLNGKRVIEFKVKQGDKTTAQRATAANDALDRWTAEPLDASELSMAPKNEDYLIVAGGNLVVTVTPADAKAAKAKDSQELANNWLKELKKATTQAPIAQ